MAKEFDYETLKGMGDVGFLDFTQKLRLKMAGVLTKDGESLPIDKDGVQALSSVLNDIDKQVISKQRVANDKDKNKNDARAVEVMGEIAALTGGRNPFRVEETSDTGEKKPVGNNGSRADRFDKSRLPSDIKVVPGETTVGVKDETYDTFKSEWDADHKRDVDE